MKVRDGSWGGGTEGGKGDAGLPLPTPGDPSEGHGQAEAVPLGENHVPGGVAPEFRLKSQAVTSLG